MALWLQAADSADSIGNRARVKLVREPHHFRADSLKPNYNKFHITIARSLWAP